MILSLVNPVMGLFRPDKDDPKRKWFNLFHHSFGYLALILSTATMTLGLDQLFGLPGMTKSPAGRLNRLTLFYSLGLDD